MFNTHDLEFSSDPFNHWVMDNFLDIKDAKELSHQFIDYESSEDVVHYQGWIAEKKTCNIWNRFPTLTYKTFSNLLSVGFVNHISTITGITPLYPDIGLHGGGWHIHSRGGKLNVHLDYSIHPKTGLQRKLNLIVYLTENWKTEWGGGLEFWSHDSETNKPLKKEKTIDNVFNRAVLFDTTQNSWHGIPQPINCPKGVYRKSLAVYYMTDPDEYMWDRKRALYAPTKEQEDNQQVLDFIEQRVTLDEK